MPAKSMLVLLVLLPWGSVRANVLAPSPIAPLLSANELTNAPHDLEHEVAPDGSEPLSSREFQLFARSVQLIADPQCKRDLNATLWAIVNGDRWAIAMYDATVKSVVGIESAMLHHFGHFDECLNMQQQHHQQEEHTTDVVLPASGTIRTKYCLADVTLPRLTAKTGARRKTPTNATTVHWGACVPATCMAADVATFLQNFLQHRRVTVDDKLCQSQHEHQHQQLHQQLHLNDELMLAYALVILFFLLMAVLSTLYHMHLLWPANDEKKYALRSARAQTLQMALLSFSVIENTKKIFQASKDQLGLNSINGIKALAMLLILAGHAISFIYGGPLYNVDFINQQVKVPLFGFLSNSLLFVDTFLLLSGFLFCRILLIELERRRGKINVFILYAARYIRLTPAYMAVIGFYMTWFPIVGSGPLWQQRILREQARCRESWWLNILYINNYIHTDKLCMFQSWYLSVDSQLFFLAPIAIYFLYKSRKYGLHCVGGLVLLTSAVPFIVTFINKLDPTLLVYPDELTDLASNAFYIGSYIKTHMRASAYVIGLLTGFLVHLMQEKNIKLSSKVVRVTWLASVGIGLASMFSICHFYTHSYGRWESALYSGFHKLGWNLSVAWLVLAVTTGHASWLGWLSHPFFAPISRLTYCAYLSNGLVELYHSSTVRSPGYKNYVNMFNDIVGHTFDTFILALVLCLLFESPIHALERILLRRVASGDRSKGNTAKPARTESQSPSTSEEQVA